MRIEQRRARRQPLERTVGVPRPVAELEHALPGVLVPDLIVRSEIGNVGEFLAHAQRLILAKQGDRGLERAKMPREVEMLVLRQMLIGEDQDRVSRERVLDRRNVGGAISFARSTSPISAAKLGVTGQTVIAMVIASRIFMP